MKKRVVAVHGRAPTARRATASGCGREALSVTFAGLDIAEISRLPLKRLAELFAPYADGTRAAAARSSSAEHPEKAIVAQRIAEDLVRAARACCSTSGSATCRSSAARRRSRPASCSACGWRRRSARTCSASSTCSTSRRPGLHPADTEALLAALDRLKASGNSLFVVEHELDVIRHADWIVDVGPGAGRARRRRSSTAARPTGSRRSTESQTRALPVRRARAAAARRRATPRGLAATRAASRATTCTTSTSPSRSACSRRVTGVSGSGKSSLVSQALVELVAEHLGHDVADGRRGGRRAGARRPRATSAAASSAGMERIKRLVRVDQKPIGRTPRSNLATYTGLFDHVRKLFAATKAARARRYDAGRFSFNVAKGRCETCEGEGFVMVELLFLPSVYAPCPTCHGARYNAKTLEITYRGKNIADVLAMTVDAACEFFADEPQSARAARRPARGRPRLPAPRPAGDRAVRRRGAAHQARDRAAARRSAATRSTSSTSRPPACTRPTSSS